MTNDIHPARLAAASSLGKHDIASQMKAVASRSKNVHRQPRKLDFEPLAESYLETTVIYCNITGITSSWAGTRESSQGVYVVGNLFFDIIRHANVVMF
jgi:hypothetical protein